MTITEKLIIRIENNSDFLLAHQFTHFWPLIFDLYYNLRVLEVGGENKLEFKQLNIFNCNTNLR